MSETDETLYEHAGGDECLHRFEEIFTRRRLPTRSSKTSLLSAYPSMWII
jgi:hypothetical protein